ncbi:MAG TPA: PEGA domain-containing protein, partial [Polyangiaceae bacterium]|nr:PEGA domain-containing protein [Polyangiaceae bacterium]
MMRAAYCLLVLLGLSFGTRSAHADTASEAQLQFELGAELYKQARYTEALERFIASNRLVPNANVVQNIVQTFEFLHRSADAYNWNETYLGLVTDAGKREAALRRREALAADIAVVHVQTDPSGAELFVDREELGVFGTSPRRIAVEAGKRRIQARLPKHNDAVTTVAAVLGQAVAVSLQLSPHKGSLAVHTTPAGALVRLEASGEELGRTPLRAPLPVGEYRVVITLQGHLEQTKQIRIGNQQEVQLSLSLLPLASEVSVLTVQGNVPGAKVWLDGAMRGATPLTIPTVRPGNHRLEVRADGRESWTGSVLLEPGSATRVDYDLVDPRDRPWPGWRWVGYGAGGALFAAGAVTGLIARGTRSDFEREPSSATLDRLRAQNTAADI